MSHPLQTPAWGDFRKQMGIDVVPINGWIISFHNIPYTPWTIGYFPKGPMPTEKMITELRALGKKKNAIFIQLEPNAQRSTINDLLSLVPSHHPLFTKYTFVLDLTKSEEELLKAMHSKTRYNIKIAQKHGVEIKKDDDAFEEYLRLTKETTKRQGFFAHSETYHRTMWSIMRKAGIAHLFTASYRQKVLTTWIVFVVGDTMYYPYGASSTEHREVMAPTLLLWEIAKWGKTQGIKKFDLWGADEKHGFHRFKQGFSPQLVEFAGSYDLVIHNYLYQMYKIADRVRWRTLHGASTIFRIR